MERQTETERQREKEINHTIETASTKECAWVLVQTTQLQSDFGLVRSCDTR